MIQNYFIAGTDYEVGKTFVTCLLLRSLRDQGIDAMGFKPVACGDRTEARDIRNSVEQPTYKLESINPVYLRTLAEPIMAAEMERTAIEIPHLVQAYEQLAAAHSTVLVDGCGAWETPLAPGVTMADFAQALDIPVILVVNNRPGAAGLAKLTVEAIQKRGLTCKGIILNHIGEEWSTASVTNARVVAEQTALPVLAELIHGQDYLEFADILN